MTCHRAAITAEFSHLLSKTRARYNKKNIPNSFALNNRNMRDVNKQWIILTSAFLLHSLCLANTGDKKNNITCYHADKYHNYGCWD